MKKFFFTTIVFGMLLLATSFASAYTMWDIQVGNTLNVTDYNELYEEEFFGAGMFKVTASNTTTTVDFTSWCAEHDEFLTIDANYTILDVYDPSHESAWLLTKYYDGHWTELNNDKTAQAQFQRALWHFDSDGYNANDRKNDSDESYYKDNLKDYITIAEKAVTAGWTNNNYIKIANLDYDDEKVQDIYIPNNPAPEPATMVLFGIGLLGLGALGRKKQI